MKESPIPVDEEFQDALDEYFSQRFHTVLESENDGREKLTNLLQKKYQEGELKGRIAENEESVYLIQSVKSIDQFDRNFISLKLADRKDELESQLERKEQ